jgi:hypothetical protein
MRTQSAQFPDWWRLAPGECREGMLVFPGSLNGIGTGATGACRNPWLGANLGGGYLWGSEDRCGSFYPCPAPGWGFLRLAFARDTETYLAKDQRYIAGVITLDPNLGDPGECAGCATPACFAVNQIELIQPAGQIPPQEDIYIVNAPIERLFVTWQGGEIGGYGCPLSVPTRRTTWGAIKAIYR